MSDYTITYSETAEGFPSFYSFFPDWMIGMNNYFYSFKGGNLYRHNVNETRNNFYGVQSYSQIKSVFNDSPLKNKLFKTINLESDQSWDTLLATDINGSGIIESEWYVEKEGAWFSHVRNTGTVPASSEEYALRSANGIGRSQSVTGTNNTPIISFSTNPIVSIGSILSVGDIVYFALPPYETPQLAGKVTFVEVDLKNNINRITLDATIAGAVSPIPIQDAFILYVKDQVAESHGVLGHYCEFSLTNNSTEATELFAVESEVMKSNP